MDDSTRTTAALSDFERYLLRTRGSLERSDLESRSFMAALAALEEISRALNAEGHRLRADVDAAVALILDARRIGRKQIERRARARSKSQ